VRLLQIIIFAVFLFPASARFCYSLDWKKLHEEADKKSLQGALDDVSKSPDSPEALYGLGLVCLSLHRDKESEDAFSRMLRSSPGSVEARWGLAEVLRRQHKVSESEEALNKLIEESPGFYPACITLAYIKFTRLEFKQAIKLAGDVLNRGKDKVDLSNIVRAHLITAGAKGMLAHNGNILDKLIYGTDVMPHLKRARGLQPDSPGVLFGFGGYYLLAPSIAGGDVDKAIEFFERAIKADPLFADACVRLAQAFLIKGDRNRYDENIRKALAIDQQNELALDITSGRCKFICIRK
jgi:cellulose synthase operon protein C